MLEPQGIAVIEVSDWLEALSKLWIRLLNLSGLLWRERLTGGAALLELCAGLIG
jgi:hypothetical protein